MSVGVDTRNNCIIVSAPQQLFEEVEQLVRTLDQAEPPSPQSTAVVSLKYASSELTQQALTNLLGEQAQTNGRTSSNNRSNNNRTQNSGRQNNGGGFQFNRAFGGGGFGGGGSISCRTDRSDA